MRLQILFTSVWILLGLRLFASPDTTIVERHFSKKQLNDDVSFLIRTIEKVHPNMYHSIDRRKYQYLADSVRNALLDGMTERQVWPILARLVGALGEGHSTFNYPDSLAAQLKNGSRHLFPIIVKEFNGRNLVVNVDLSMNNGLRPGDQITSINGISSSALIDKLSGYTGGLKTYRSINVCLNLISYLYLYNINSPYTINYLRNGSLGSVTIKAVSWSELIVNNNGRAKLSPSVPEPDYSLKSLDPNIAYLSINSFAAAPAVFKRFLDSCFNKLQQTRNNKLIIDLRKNGGGNSQLARILLGYITEKPFRMTGGVSWKVSQEYKDKMDKELGGKGAEKMAYYFNEPNGSSISDTSIKVTQPEKNNLYFPGKVFVLIGPRTFSSANMLANTIQDYKLATLVGEPSGEPANDYGEVIYLKLPNTGFSFSTSTKQFIRANGDVKNNLPVQPLYKVADELSTAEDEVIQFVKQQ
jgi:C-terminal processing protease CtpA/Prc